MKYIVIIHLIFFSFAASLLSQSQPCDTSVTVHTLEPVEYRKKLIEFSNPLLLDVRDNSHYKRYRLKNSLHIPGKKELLTTADTLDKNEPVFVYCQVGFRSNQVSKILEEEGFTCIYNLKKGIKNWKKQKLPVEKIKRHERKKNE